MSGRGHLSALAAAVAAALGAGVAIVPTVAGSESVPSIEATESTGRYEEVLRAWTPSAVSVSPGASVTISNPTATNHGVYWVDGPAKPVCGGSVPVGTSAEASGAHWSGSCSFSAPGVYTFYCTVHGPQMTGRITVSASGSTETTVTSTPTLSTPSSTTPGTGPPATSPLAGSPGRAVRLSAQDHGRFVAGSVAVAAAGVGGRLRVEVLARAASLASSPRRLLVGRLLRELAARGVVHFRIRLDRRARAVLSARGRLSVTVELTLTPPQGTPAAVSRTLLLRR